MIKVCLQQPSLPTYRKAFFEKLNKFVQLCIFYGNDGIPSKLPNNVELRFSPLHLIKIWNKYLKWHTAQIKAVNSETDVSILSWDVQYVTLWLAILKSFMLQKPLILWGHGYSKNDNVIKSSLRNLPAKFAKAIILYDYHTAEVLRNKSNFRNKIFVAPNSIDQQSILNAKEYWLADYSRLKQFQREHKIDGTFNIIYIGRIYKENRLEILINAFQKVIYEIKNVRLIIIGELNSFGKELQLEAKKLGISEYIIWTGAIYNEINIAPWMLSSKLFCYPSNVGLSLMHAFGYGLPAITDNEFKKHGPEIWALVEGYNGLTFTTYDKDALALKIIKLYKDEVMREELSKNALFTIIEKFNLDKMVEGFLQAISYVLEK